MSAERIIGALRVGIVHELDPVHARVRVVFPDRDQLRSYWLAVITAKTQDDKAYFMPDLGEQVVCLMDERDESGAVVGAIYSQADVPPVQSADKFHLSFRDGAAAEYDRAAHALQVALPQGATLTIMASGSSIAIDASGNVNVTAAGNLGWSADGISARAGTISLGAGVKGVARLGDTVQVKDDEGNTLTGTIISASATVTAQD